jgi:hypothetical protein
MGHEVSPTSASRLLKSVHKAENGEQATSTHRTIFASFIPGANCNEVDSTGVVSDAASLHAPTENSDQLSKHYGTICQGLQVIPEDVEVHAAAYHHPSVRRCLGCVSSCSIM